MVFKFIFSENKWVKWHPKALKSRVSTLLKPDTATKASVTAKLDKLSAARLELVQLQMETTLKQHQFIEDEHNKKMIHLDNDEARKQEMHEIIKEKLRNTGPILNGNTYNM